MLKKQEFLYLKTRGKKRKKNQLAVMGCCQRMSDCDCFQENVFLFSSYCLTQSLCFFLPSVKWDFREVEKESFSLVFLDFEIKVRSSFFFRLWFVCSFVKLAKKMKKTVNLLLFVDFC